MAILADRVSACDRPSTLPAAAMFDKENRNSDEEFEADGGEFRVVPDGTEPFLGQSRFECASVS
ncbi:hypothetical protein [Streptomyces clavifer]|uniref:hypothetical protein n=1 Tax=Streptomyces clavifer TaxID=68188 RepID=UPI00382A74CE